MRSAKEEIMPRPKILEVRDVQLKLNLTTKEYERLVLRAAAAGMIPNRFGRALVLSENIFASRTHVPSTIEKLNYVALSRVGSNLNQMMRHLHRTGAPAPPDLEPLLSEIRRIMIAAMEQLL
jgi:hypothetical protein